MWNRYPKREDPMFRTFHIARAAAIALAIAIASTAPAAAAPKTVQGSVGPGFSIGLELGSKKVTGLKHGTYRFVINDRSSIHDFHLTGPGLNRMLTTVDFVGTKSVVLTLKKGVYKYVCDPHAELMHGSFRVV
jgi:plastocyanin